ncbi:MAG TPA: hypothetical protein VJN48_12145 [Terriglobales bacterium]|nr:hypothetical protein [Terriglobales bacterium]
MARRTNQAGKIVCYRPQILNTIQAAKIGEGAVVNRMNCAQILCSQYLEPDWQTAAPRAPVGHADHGRRNIEGVHLHASFCKMERIYAGSAVELKYTLAGQE